MIPGGGARNREYYGPMVRISDEVSDLLTALAFDPQTSGGLLISLPEEQAARLLAALHAADYPDAAIVGRVVARAATPLELV
jgi:selenide,water dikinase